TYWVSRGKEGVEWLEVVCSLEIDWLDGRERRDTMQDSLCNNVTNSSTEALRQIDAAIDLHARAWPGALEAADAATREDPELSIGHALQGLIHAMWGRRSAAAECMSRARSSA